MDMTAVETFLRVTAQQHHVGHAGVGVRTEDLVELLLGVAHAGQVRHREHRGLAGDPAGDLDRPVAGRATGAVGHRHEGRPVGLEVADRLPQLGLARLVLRREELERERPTALADEAANARGLLTHAVILGSRTALPGSCP